MYIADSNFKQEYLKFLRQYFFEKRILFLEGPIDHSYINDPTMPIGWGTTPRAIIDQIIYLNSLNHDPIKLIIDSPGGSVAATFNLYDTMTGVQSPIHTICMGLAVSAASLILAAGASGKRFILPSSESMIHLPQTQIRGDSNEIDIAVRRFKRIKDKYIELLSRHVNRSVGEIDASMQQEKWMNAEETVNFGLADQVALDFARLELAA